MERLIFVLLLLPTLIYSNSKLTFDISMANGLEMKLKDLHYIGGVSAEVGYSFKNKVNVEVLGTTFITPIFQSVGAKIVFAPLVFLSFNTGVEVGGGNSITGATGLSRIGYTDDYRDVLFQVYTGMEFRFDLAYFMPHNIRGYTHFVMKNELEFSYRYFTGSTTFYYLDSPFNRNGVIGADKLYVGYMIPIRDNNNEVLLGVRQFKITILTSYAMKWNVSEFFSSPMISGYGSDFINIKVGQWIRFDLDYGVYLVNGFEIGRYSSNQIYNNPKYYTSQYYGSSISLDSIMIVIGIEF